MAIFKPASVLQLTLIAFCMVALPLMLALATATISVNRLSTQGQRAVLEAARTVQLSRMLVEELTSMERNVRQYGVLRDYSLYKLYIKRHQDFTDTIGAFSKLRLTEPLRDKLNELAAQEKAVFHDYDPNSPASDLSQNAIGQFSTLSNLARTILSDSSEAIGKEVNNMQNAAEKLKTTLAWQASLVIPAVIALAVLGLLLIAKPIRSLEQAIRRLGTADFDQAIHIRGPRDLEDLGRRLDWLRNRLRELEQHRVKFLRHISHELKTPLTAIREGAQLLTDQIVGSLNAEQREVAEILHENSLQLQKRIEDLLNFSVAHNTHVLPAKHPVNLEMVVNRVIAGHKTAILAKCLDVRTDLEDARLLANSEQIQIVVDNLLSNAIKYSPQNGIVSIQLRCEQQNAILKVKDQGPGIRPNERRRIFEAFYQGDATYVSHVKGTGLGLAIAKEYTHAHFGDIRVLEVDSGACLEVTLPLDGTNTQ